MREKVVKKGYFIGNVSYDNGNTVINFFKSKNSWEVFYSFSSQEKSKCYIANEPREYCPYRYKSCRECPTAKYFIELDGDIVPVRMLDLF